MRKCSNLIININVIIISVVISCKIYSEKYKILNNLINELSLLFIIMTGLNLLYIIYCIILQTRRKKIFKHTKILLSTKHLSSSMIEIIKKHLITILRKKDICLIPDEYNIVDTSKFQKEKEYFFKKVFLREIKSDKFYISFKKNVEQNRIYNITKNNNYKTDNFLLLPKFYNIFDIKLINYKNLQKLNKQLDLNTFIMLTTRLHIKKPVRINNYIKYNSFDDFIIEYFYMIFDIIISYCNNLKQSDNSNLKTGIDLEVDVSKRLKNIGYITTLTKTSGDQGVDVLAEKNGKLIAIQCKLYSKPVGNKAVQEIIAGKSFYNADYGVVVTNNEYTRSAKELANKCEIYLFNIDYLESSFEKIFNYR